jgi:uncharacterized protein (UPF0261 family)
MHSATQERRRKFTVGATRVMRCHSQRRLLAPISGVKNIDFVGDTTEAARAIAAGV